MENIIYIITAKATAVNNREFVSGEMHAMNIFYKGDAAREPDFDYIKNSLWDKGWENLNFIKYGKLTDKNLDLLDEGDSNLKAAYLSAKQIGLSFIVYEGSAET